MADRRGVLYAVAGGALVVLVAVAVWVFVERVGSDGPSGSREDPLPLGTVVRLGNDWSVTVNSANTRADAQVAEAEEFNEPPDVGQRYVVVNLSASNGSDEADPPAMQVSLFGSSGVEHDGANFVTPPDPRLDTISELAPGASTAGNLVFAADVDETDLMLRIQPLVAVEGNQTWIALEPR